MCAGLTFFKLFLTARGALYGRAQFMFMIRRVKSINRLSKAYRNLTCIAYSHTNNLQTIGYAVGLGPILPINVQIVN